MFKKLTYKQKTIYLIISAVILLIIIYVLNIHRTIKLREEYRQLNKELASLSNAPAELNRLRTKTALLDASIGTGKNNSKEKILGVAGEYCGKHNVIIKELPQTHVFSNDNYLINTNILKLEGNFRELLFMLYHIEQVQRVGIVSSARFFIYYDYKKKREILNAEFYIQNIKINETTSSD